MCRHPLLVDGLLDSTRIKRSKRTTDLYELNHIPSAHFLVKSPGKDEREKVSEPGSSLSHTKGPVSFGPV